MYVASTIEPRPGKGWRIPPIMLSREALVTRMFPAVLNCTRTEQSPTTHSEVSIKSVRMPPRFPTTEAPDVAAKGIIEDALGKMHDGTPPFKWVEDDGNSLIGCYAPLCYTTAPWTQQFFELAKLCYSPGGAKPRNRELAILGLSSVLVVPYVVYCHHEVAQRFGITDEQYKDGLAGRVPSGLTEEETIAYRLGRILTTQIGPLDDKMWSEITSAMGKSEFVAILHTIAGYRWVSMLEQANGEDRRWARSDSTSAVE